MSDPSSKLLRGVALWFVAAFLILPSSATFAQTRQNVSVSLYRFTVDSNTLLPSTAAS
jgi:hypothetical protein